MALLKEQVLYNADVVRYHRLHGVELSTSSDVATAVVHSFRNEAECRMYAAPVTSRKIPFRHSGVPARLQADAYAHIKTLPEFAGAEDV